jgi:hypothetical protein
LGNNIVKESISTSTKEARVFSTLAADKRLAANKKSKGFWAPNADEKSGKHTMPTTTGQTRSPSSRPLTLTGSDVDKRHFSTRNADGGSEFSTPDVDKKQRQQKSKFSTPDVNKKQR